VTTSVGGSGGVAGGGANEDVSRAAEGQLFLDRMRDVWEDHCACMSKLKDVLKYLVSCRSLLIKSEFS